MINRIVYRYPNSGLGGDSVGQYSQREKMKIEYLTPYF